MRLFQKIKASWKPTPIDPPQVDSDLEKLDSLTRSAESLRYSMLTIEWWVSPNGRLREWLRHNIRLGCWLVIPSVLVVPAITFLLWQLVKWVTMLTSITGHLIVFPVLALVALLVMVVVIFVARAIFR
jgi:hypothetical protein